VLSKATEENVPPRKFESALPFFAGALRAACEPDLGGGAIQVVAAPAGLVLLLLTRGGPDLISPRQITVPDTVSFLPELQFGVGNRAPLKLESSTA